MVEAGRDARLGLVAGRQGGAFSFAQALNMGFPRATISRRLSSGAWVRAAPGVFTLAGMPRSRSGDMWAAVLAVGERAAITHESSALLHGAEHLAARPITLTAPHGTHHRVPGTFVHQINDLLPRHRTSIHRLPVSTPARSVVELAATQPIDTIGRVADDLVRLGRTSYSAIAGVLADVARPGKPRIENVAVMLDERTGGFVPPASELERALFAALDAGGLPPPERQVLLPGRGIRGVVDGAYSDARIVLEADGRRWHQRMASARADRERDAQVVRAGWVPLRFVYEQIVHEPATVCEVVDDTRRGRLDLLRRAA